MKLTDPEQLQVHGIVETNVPGRTVRVVETAKRAEYRGHVLLGPLALGILVREGRNDVKGRRSGAVADVPVRDTLG